MKKVCDWVDGRALYARAETDSNLLLPVACIFGIYLDSTSTGGEVVNDKIEIGQGGRDERSIFCFGEEKAILGIDRFGVAIARQMWDRLRPIGSRLFVKHLD